jgi:hypothetical protein
MAPRMARCRRRFKLAREALEVGQVVSLGGSSAAGDGRHSAASAAVSS